MNLVAKVKNHVNVRALEQWVVVRLVPAWTM